MAITVAQRNAGAYQLLLEMAAEFPQNCDAALWIIVSTVKTGTNLQKEIARELLNRMIESATGQDPTGNAALKHRAKHRLYEVLSKFVADHPGLSDADCFEPEPIVVN